MNLKHFIIILLLGAVGCLVWSTGRAAKPPTEAAPAPATAQGAGWDEPRWHYKKGDPLQLKFTAVDGRKVDLEQLRGRVVLIDFWATWCGPCMEEVPRLRAAYQQFHDQGFEIIGISLDQDQAALKRVVAKEKMTWPHYFETKGLDNRIAAAFGIEEIPTMWLVDRNGFLRETNAVDNLSGKVQRLVAEKRSGPPSNSNGAQPAKPPR